MWRKIQVIARPHIDWFALAPVNSLLAASALALLCAVLAPRSSRKVVTATLCALGYATALGFAIALYVKSPHGHGVVVDAFRRDRLAELTGDHPGRLGAARDGDLVRERWREDHVGEYYALLAAAGAGMLFFVGANNLMTLFLGLEWFSICLYILCAIDRDRLGGARGRAEVPHHRRVRLGSAAVRLGARLRRHGRARLRRDRVPPVASTTRCSSSGWRMIIAGLAFKASAAPFHMWTPDVYEGAPTPVTAFMAAATKTAALVVMLRILVTAFPDECRHLDASRSP